MGKIREEVTAAEGLDSYRRWQQREASAWQERTIANGDPECEELIAALEAGWLKTQER